MCNACLNVCCGSDRFEKCGCDGCHCEACWSDEPEDMDEDEFYECANPPLENTGDTVRSMGEPAMTESHSVAVSPTQFTDNR
jgi:hypothetical protein